MGSYPLGASPYGVLDMAGNVTEWVNDYWDINYYSVTPYANPTGPDSGDGRVMRGGSWYVWDEYQRTAYRAGTPADWREQGDMGFRCAASN